MAEISISHKKFSDILVWMLRRDVVLQLFSYLLLIVPEDFAAVHRTEKEDEGFSFIRRKGLISEQKKSSS